MNVGDNPLVYVQQSPPDARATYNFPPQRIPDRKLKSTSNYTEYKSPQWFCDNIRYICCQYNSINTFRQPYLMNGQQPQPNSVTEPYLITGYVTEMVENMMYYFGWQNNLDYAFLTQDLATNNLQAPWIKGQDIAKLVDFVVGNICRQLRNAVWSATPVNEDTLTSRESIYNKLIMVLQMQPIFDEMEKAGIVFQPAGMNAPKFKTKYEINEFLDKNYNEYSSELDQRIAIATWVEDRWMESISLAAKFVLCTGWGCGEHIVKNGVYTFEVFPSYQAIIDTRKDSDFNRYGQYRARVFYMTPTEIFAEYPELNKEEREDIQLMAATESLGKQWNGATGVLWWNYAPYGTVGVVRAYWDTLREERKKTVNGQIQGVPTGEDSEHYISDLCQGTIIGNKYLVRYGYCDNIVEGLVNPADISKPITIFIPNMMAGMNRSFVGRLKYLQNEIDALEFKQREFIGRAKGKVVFLHSDKLGGGVDVKELEEDLVTMGFHVLTHNGEIDDDKRPPLTAVDLSLDSAGLTFLWTITKEKRKYMEEFAGYSEIAAGQQNFYVGGKVQDQSINQTNLALSGIIDGFIAWIEQSMQYACDVQKIMPSNWRIERAIGEAGIEFLKNDKDMLFSRNQIELRVNDVISDAKRTELMQMAVARASTGDPTAMLDFAKMQRLPTWTLVSDFLEHALKRNMEAQEKLQLQQEAREAQKQAIIADSANNAQIAMEDSRQETSKDIAQGKAKTQLADTAMRQGVPPQEAIAAVS